MKNTAYIDHSFDRSQSSSYHESIQITLDGFCVCIIDIEAQKIVYYDEVSLNLRRYGSINKKFTEWISSDEIFSLPFKYSTILFKTANYTLVPAPFFKVEVVDKFLSFNVDRSPATNALSGIITKANTYVIFEMPSNLLDTIQYRNKNSVIQHSSFPLVDATIDRMKSGSKIHLQVHFSKSYFDLLILQGNKLQHLSSFHTESEADRLYFVLAMIKQLNLDPETIEFEISGRMETKDAFVIDIRKYVRNVTFASLKNLKLDYSFIKEVPEHVYYPFLNLYQCE